jgi:hypothetical protein
MPVRLPIGIACVVTACCWMRGAAAWMRSGVSSSTPSGADAKPGWVGCSAWHTAPISASTSQPWRNP